jgi:hypothetical protein
VVCVLARQALFFDFHFAIGIPKGNRL